MLRGLTPLDRLVLAFTAAITCALPWVRPPTAGWIAAAHVLVAGLAWLAPRARRVGGWGPFLADFYPLLIDWAFYAEVGMLNQARGVSYDAAVQAWERALFGGQPSQLLMTAWPSPVVSTVLHLAYVAKYPMLFTPVLLWGSGRREAAREVLFLTLFTFYVCYVIFLLFPVAGPRYLFSVPQTAAAHTASASFTRGLLEAGSAWGTAFPSSHVAVTLVVAGATWRFSRRLGVPLLAIAALLALGTVYGGFHYAVDALAGAVLGALILAARPWILRHSGFRQPV